jgi:prolactin regulatory element-binding protein
MLCEHELEKGEDAPMSIAAHPEVCHTTLLTANDVLNYPQSRSVVCGINSSKESLEKGENENCRVFSISESGNAYERLHLRLFTILTIPYSLIKGITRGTLPSGALEDYQVAHSLLRLLYISHRQHSV